MHHKSKNHNLKNTKSAATNQTFVWKSNHVVHIEFMNDGMLRLAATTKICQSIRHILCYCCVALHIFCDQAITCEAMRAIETVIRVALLEWQYIPSRNSRCGEQIVFESIVTDHRVLIFQWNHHQDQIHCKEIIGATFAQIWCWRQ